jgi:endonuclease III
MKGDFIVKSVSSKQTHLIQLDYPIETVLNTLDASYDDHPMDRITQHDPFKVLVACIMSLRTKDDLTIPLAEKLFTYAATPEAIAAMSVEALEQAIYPVGFYKTKAKNILEICRVLIQDYQSQVPDTVEALLEFKGVGRKTANLVVGLGHQKPSICVDVHVYRICNRLGYLHSSSPDETEFLLRDHVPVSLWPLINKVLVLHGQAVCKPVGPLCHQCPIEPMCQKVEVKPRKPQKLKP